MSEKIESVLQESRRFSPSQGFRQHAKLNSLEQYQTLYRQSLDDPDTFWSNVAS